MDVNIHTVNYLLGHNPLTLSDEKVLQNEVEALFKAHSIPYEREVYLNKGDIIDFVIDGNIGLEIKIGGSKRNIYKQCERYCEHERISTLILASNRAMKLPRCINDKRVYVNMLGVAWL